MALREIFPGLAAASRRAAAEKRYIVQGRGEVRLGESDFRARGGEGSIYVRGSTAYKIYADPRRAVPREKIAELSALALDNIVRPLDVLLDAGGTPVGYTMRAVGNSYALCQLFPKAFRRRHGLTPDATLRLVQRLQEGVAHAHAKGILLVDLNEMNFLVAEDFGELYFIDVDSYQTPSYPATVLMESVRDRHARRFTTGSDWFSFAVVSFQMFVGIHPFKGTYAPLRNLPDQESRLDARMRANVSVLHPGVSVPASCLPFSVIPPAYLDWYRAVFEEGERLPPPASARPSLAPAPAPARGGDGIESGRFEVEELREFDGEILGHDGPVTITSRAIYFDGRKYPRPPFDARAAATPRLRHLIAAYADGGRPRLRDLTDSRDLDLGIGCEEIMLCGGRFYVRQRAGVFAVEFVELPGGVVPGLRLAANVAADAARLFEGLALQNLPGATYASLFPAPGLCRQVRLPELDGYRVADARLDRNVLMIVGARAGRRDKFVVRFAEDFRAYDARLLPDVSSAGINFTVLDGGLVLHLTDEDALEVFPRRAGSPGIRVVRDAAVGGDARLFRAGAQALLARGPKLYRFSMRRSQAAAGPADAG